MNIIPILFTIALMNAPFGSWESPITTDLLVQESISFRDMQTDGHSLFWTELHPKEKGRIALIRYNGEETPLAKGVSVRSRVHEYGGAAFLAAAGSLIISNDEDGQLYQVHDTGMEKLTHAPSSRFADGSGPFWVCETHGKEKVENTIVSVEEGALKTVASGHDFYSSPRLSPDGKRLAFITWDFPNMQWDSSTLWLAEVTEKGELHNLKSIAGGSDESVCQVQWSREGELHFVSDRTGYWNLYRLRDGSIESLCELEAEFGIPAWMFGFPTYAFLPDGRIACAYTVLGVDAFGIIDPETQLLDTPDLPFTLVQNLISLHGKVYFFGASPTLPTSIICFDPASSTYEIIKQSNQFPFDGEWISQGEILEYPAQEGKKGYAFYYPPKNPHFQAPAGEKPPLIVKSHGGPTARTYAYLMPEIQYWTSRGFAFVDVNYSGSTGYGREYFKRLEGNWGIADVHDCISAAKTLVKEGRVDGDRLLIRGGSAGGYTTLAALTWHDVFAAGTSYYGVSDLELLYADTHKFEAKYTDLLVAPYPEEIDLIRERSPITHIEKLSKPILLLQGSEDKIVPPNQAKAIYDAASQKGLPVGMLIFEGEGHGFRSAPNIQRALDAELYFYSKVLGIDLAKPFKEPPVEILNLP